MGLRSGDTDILLATCYGCGAPLVGVATIRTPIKCDYCDLMNYAKRSQKSADGAIDEFDEEEESERSFLIYQEAQNILQNFPGETIGDDIGKLKIKVQIGAYAFPLMVVIDDLPEKPYIDGPSKLRDILDCDLADLEAMKNWKPGESKPLDVLDELYQRIETTLGDTKIRIEKQPETVSIQADKDPLINAILNNFESEIISKGKLRVTFYTPEGDNLNLFIKRKKNYPIEVDSNILIKFPLLRGTLEDYAKGRIDILNALSEIERSLYK